MSDNTIDTEIDVPTPILRALVYQEVFGPYDPVAIAITDDSIDVIEDKLDILDVAEVPAEKYREAYSGKHVMYKPPFNQGWVSVGSLHPDDLDEALLEAGYVDKEKGIDDIVDAQAFEAKPVKIAYVSPKSTHFRLIK